MSCNKQPDKHDDGKSRAAMINAAQKGAPQPLLENRDINALA
jgi:hypothetical protein